jgi:hypothetical protein
MFNRRVLAPAQDGAGDGEPGCLEEVTPIGVPVIADCRLQIGDWKTHTALAFQVCNLQSRI